MSGPEWHPAVDPVLCSPYEPPDRHWALDDLGRALPAEPLHGRRDAVSIGPPLDRKQAQAALDLRDRRPNPLVQDIRAKVDDWRRCNYPCVTPTTRRLLHYWTDPQGPTVRPFFAQVEAVETLIWLREVATRGAAERKSIEDASRDRNDGIVRWCSKMATGTGKTAVMGMVIAWQTLNAEHSRRRRNIMHTDRFAVFAPGHTVRERLEVLKPSAPGNVYDEMGIVPRDLRMRLNRAKVRIVNYQAFTQRELIGDPPARRLLGVGRGDDIESWPAAVRRVLGDLVDAPGGVCVINDEAHHCYPPRAERAKGVDAREEERAGVWFNAVRALRDMGALGAVNGHGQAHPVLDFSATPLWIDTSHRGEPEQFEWVASDFSLMDAIESGLVKVPRVPIDDDCTRDETVWRRLYRNTAPKDLASCIDSGGGLPEALNGALRAVIDNWRAEMAAWLQEPDPQPTPPVLIVVANSIRNATALWRWLGGGPDGDGRMRQGAYPELSNVAPDGGWHPSPRTLVVHSRADEDTIPGPLRNAFTAAAGVEGRGATEMALRRMLNTVGKTGEPGAQVRCVVSVSMLTEGWDARTVTHIVGFRQFSTQLLCEQVTGRALRRTSYEDFNEPDADSRARFGDNRRRLVPQYADVVGIPFDLMSDMDKPSPRPKSPNKRTRVRSVPGRARLRVSWPQVVEYLTSPQRHTFELDPASIEWEGTGGTPTKARLHGTVGAETVLQRPTLTERRRTLTTTLAAAVAAGFHTDNRDHGRLALFRSAFAASEAWIAAVEASADDLAEIVDSPQTLAAAVDSIRSACRSHDEDMPRLARLASPAISDTAGVDFETTLRHVHPAARSELSDAACHSRLEQAAAAALDNDRRVDRWVRNYQLGWSLPYRHGNIWRHYEPDFVAVLSDGGNMIIECKGVYDAKAADTERWTVKHWIPCVAGTTELPDELRRWTYGIVEDHGSAAHRLGLIIDAAHRGAAR